MNLVWAWRSLRTWLASLIRAKSATRTFVAPYPDPYAPQGYNLDVRIYFTGVFSRRLDGRTLAFRFEGGTILDEETGSEWSALGEAVAGELSGWSPS